MIPDIEAVLCNYLRDAIAATGARVGTKAPPTHIDPWVRVTLLDAPSKGGGERLIDAFLQADCFAGNAAMDAEEGIAEANDVARATRSAFIDLIGQTVDGVVFSSVRIVGFRRGDDNVASEPARDNYSVAVEIAHHG